MSVPFSLERRRALVTGANSDIGAAIAGGLAELGADLILHHFGAREATETFANRLRATGCDAQIAEADFLDVESVAPFAATLSRDYGPIDIIVACTAVERRKPWAQVTAADFHEHLAAGATALISLCSVLVPSMCERGWGRVVAIGTVLSDRPRAETIPYAAAKSAQLTAIRAMARDVGPHGVTMNVVSPGAIETQRMASRYADPDFRKTVTAKIPVGRPGRPDDVVGPVLMLCSDAGGYVTGVNIPVDGGWTAGDAPGGLPGATP